MASPYPRARRDEMLLSRIEQELIIYHTNVEQIYLLSPSTALVYEHLDGQTSPEALADLLAEELGLPADTALVTLALEELREVNLLEEEQEELQESDESETAPVSVSRRDILKRLSLAGAAAALLPAVQTLAVPTPAMAQSDTGPTCVPKNGPCSLNNPGVCCSKACLSLSGGLDGKCL